MTDGTVSAWVERFLFGDRETHAECEGWILAVVRHRAWSLRADEEDLLQDVRLRLVSAFDRGSFRGDSSPKTFVQAVAKHTCLNAVRRERIRRSAPLDEEQFPDSRDDPGERTERIEEARQCYDVLSRLPESCRHLFRMILIEELSYEQIAERLEIAMGTVKSRLFRCRDRATALREARWGRTEGGRG